MDFYAKSFWFLQIEQNIAKFKSFFRQCTDGIYAKLVSQHNIGYSVMSILILFKILQQCYRPTTKNVSINISYFSEVPGRLAHRSRHRRGRFHVRFPGRSKRAQSCHRCDVSSELCNPEPSPGAKPRRWIPPRVTRCGVIPRV